MLQASDKLGVAPKDIVPGFNYVQTEERDFQVDRLTYKILDMALRRASDFCMRERPLLPIDDLMRGTCNLERYRSKSTKSDQANYQW